MATNISEGSNVCTFQWDIENIRHCWVKKDACVDSPCFIANTLKGTKWFLRLYLNQSRRNGIGFFLRREKDCVGPNTIEISYQLAFLDKHGSILVEKTVTNSYQKGFGQGFPAFEDREKVFVTQRETFLPSDTLMVQCTMWNTNNKPIKTEKFHARTCTLLPSDSLMVQCTMWNTNNTPIKTEKLHARTVFKVKRRNFVWRIEKFSTLKSGLKHKLKDSLIEFDLVSNESLDFEKQLGINLVSFDENIKYFSFEVSIVDSKGKKENCGNHEYFVYDLQKGLLCTFLFIKQLMQNQSRYLPNDVLTLDCEYAFSNGTVSYEHCGFGIISPKLTNEIVVKGNDLSIRNNKSEIIPFILNDLKSMYNDRILSDMELRTSTQTFSTHKNILSARSPVFRKMICSDMKEKNNGYIDILDLEDDTIRRMLLYIYTDTLEDMPLEDACELYCAADKYLIQSLQSGCSSFLKDNLSSNKVCEILILADRYQDIDLKNAVEEFILRHSKEVFGSLEWKDFLDANSKLAADMMYRYTLLKINEL